ncbi:MAG: hypothetical protein J4G18_05085 [Anaerolineae bacterium]|nr:hypothetical protein [Anaerolineae bacterium]
MLVAQILVIAVALILDPTSEYERLLWALYSLEWNDTEWNIPATLASIQLALVGIVALLASWHAGSLPARQRIFLTASGPIFLLLALDEYLTFHEYIPNWKLYYGALGVGLAAASAYMAAQAPRRALIWYLCLIAGLAMAALGAIAFDTLWICDELGWLRFDGCLNASSWEESLEFAGIWLVLAGMLGILCDRAPKPANGVYRWLYAVPVVWVLLLLIISLTPRFELRLAAKPASVAFKTGVQLQGFHINGDPDSVTVRLYASARQADYVGLGYSIHLVDQVSGESIASSDEWADRQHGFWLFGPDYMPTYRQRMHVTIPPQSPPNRALWVVLTLWRKKAGEFARMKIVGSDLQLLDRQVVLSEMALPSDATAPSPTSLAVFDNGFTLEELEWPESAQAGDALPLRFAWRSDEDSVVDHIQFLHLGHGESGDWWVYDQQPLGRRLPTRLWYSGLADSETWLVPLPEDLAPGSYTVYTGLYRHRDNERIPALDAAGKPWSDARVRLGSIFIER